MWKTIMSRSVKYRFPLIMGLLLIFLRFYPLFFGKTVLFGDNFSLMVPGKLFSASWITKGIIPLWNPTQFAGLSWIGDINQSLFYPSTLLFILFRPNVALNLTLLSHLLLSFIGAFFLAREVSPKLSKYSWLLVAIFWSFSPQLIGALNNLATFQSISYVPWVVVGCLHFGRKKPKSWWYLPVLICLQLLGGYPQHVFFSVMFGVIFSAMIHRIVLSRWLFVGLLSLLLSAWIWLPFLQNLNQSTRSLQTTEQAQTGSLHIDDLVKIVSPVFFDNPSLGYKWGPGWNRPANLFLYFTWMGLVALIVLFKQRKKQKIDLLLLSALVVCILISFGKATPMYSILQMIPVLASSRGASTILVIATLAGALLFSRAIFALKISLKNKNKYVGLLFSISVLIGLLWLISQIYFEQSWLFANEITQGFLERSSFHTLEKDRILVTSILFSLCIQSIILLFSSWFLVKSRQLLLVLIIAFDLLFFTNQYYFFGPSNAYDAPKSTEIAARVGKKMGNNFRLLTRNYNAPYADFGAYAEALILRQPFSDSFVDTLELTSFSVALKMKELLTPGWNMPVNIPTVNGYTTLLPVLLSKDFGNTSDEHGINRLPEIISTDEQLKKWAVGYYLVDTWYPNYGEQFPDTVVASGEGWKLYQLPNALSRIRYGNGESANVIAFNENPNELVMTVESDRTQDLVVADRYDQDWRAIVNGKSVDVSDVDGMRSVSLEQGTNQIRMWYFPTLFYVGLFISGVTSVAMLIWMIVRSNRWQTK